jgi:hypothetical protein
MAAGGYEPVAEKLFNQAPVDTFLLEYDSERAGGFEPLRFLPKHKTVVLGLVSSKSAALEDGDVLRRRIDEAARVVALDQLGLSSQCGVASVAGGNVLAEEEQWEKLQLVVDTRNASGATSGQGGATGMPASMWRAPEDGPWRSRGGSLRSSLAHGQRTITTKSDVPPSQREPWVWEGSLMQAGRLHHARADRPRAYQRTATARAG